MGTLKVHLVTQDPTMQTVVLTTSPHSLTCHLVQLQDLVPISLKTQVNQYTSTSTLFEADHITDLYAMRAFPFLWLS